MMKKAPIVKNRGRIGLFAIVFTFVLALLLPAEAQLAGSGTPGDIAVFDIAQIDTTLRPTIAATTNAGPSIAPFAYAFDTTLIDPLLDSQELAPDGSINLTAGHHIMIYNTEFDSVADRAGVDSYVKLNDSIIPYGASSAYARDGNDDDLISIGGTILEVAQGDNIKLETLRTDVQADQVSERSIRLDNASVQFIKLDDTNLDFARLRLGSNSVIMPANNSGPAEVPFDLQQELDTASFDHSETTDNTDITLKETGFYLVFANSGFFITGAGGQRQAITQQVLLNGSPVNGGSSTVYLRNSGSGDVAGGLVQNGAASIGTLVEVTSTNSTLSVQILRDQNNNSGSVINLDSERTGIAIAKLPPYGNYFSLISAPQETDGSVGNIEFDFSPSFENDSFSFESGGSLTDQVVIEQTGNFLLLSSQYGTAQTDEERSTIQHVIEAANSAFDYGFGGTYNRAELNENNGEANSSGTWAGVASNLTLNTNVTVQSNTRAGAGGSISAQVSFQGLNIDTISSIPVDPVISINNPLNIVASSTGNVISSSSNLFTFDSNTTGPATLEYTITLEPLFATLRRNGNILSEDDTFTQADLDANLITVDASGSVGEDCFEFEVVDTANPGENVVSGTFIINTGIVTNLVADILTGATEDIVATEANLSTGSNLLDNDAGTSLSIFSIDGLSANGAVITASGTEGNFSYDPRGVAVFEQLAAGESLEDSFTYTAVDFAGNIATTIVTGTIAGTNDSPEAIDDNIMIPDTIDEIEANLLENDSDVDNGAVIMVSQIGNSGAGSPDMGIPGSLTFTSTLGAVVTVGDDGFFLYDISQTTAFFDLADETSLSETFLYEITDDFGATDTASVTVEVTGAPGASTDLAYVNATVLGGDPCDPPVTIAYLANDTVTGSVAGTLSVNNPLAVEFDAATTTNTNTTWINTGVTSTQGTASLVVELGTLVTPANAPPGVTAAYEFDGGAGASGDSGVAFTDLGDDGAWGGGTNNAPGGNIDEGDATLEFVFRPSDQVGSEVLWETGGGTVGSSIVLVGNQIVASFSDADNFGVQTAATLPAGAVANGEFVHLIVHIDQDGNAGSHLRLYVNGILAASSANTQINLNGTGATNQLNDWSGTDDGGLAIDDSAIGGDPDFGNVGTINVNSAVDFAGEIALYRVYDNLLDESEITSSFEAIFGTSSPATLGDLASIDGTTVLIAGVTQLTLDSGALLDYDGTTVAYTPNNALVELTTGGFVNASDIGVGLEAIDRIPYQLNTGINSIGSILVRIKGTNTSPQISISAPNPDVNEGTTPPNAFELTSSLPVGSPLNVTLGFTGAALQGTDYIATTTVSFSGSSANVSVDAINDSLFEGAEDLIATIVAVDAGAVIGSQNTATITINDAQSAPMISIAGGGSITEGNTLPVTINATVASDEDITLTVAYSGTAMNGFDAFVPATVTIPAGSSSVSPGYPTADDGFTEAAETYSLQIGGPNIGTVDTSVASGDITDGSGSHVFFATFDNTGLFVDVNLPFDDTLTTGLNASAAANAGTEIGTWANVFGGGTTIGVAPNGVIFEVDDVKGTLGLEYDGQAAGLGSVPKNTSRGPDVDQFLRQDRPGTSEQTVNILGSAFAQVTAEFVDAIDVSGSNTGFIAFDINNRRTTDGPTKNSELWAVDTNGEIVLRLIITGDNNPGGGPQDERLLVATDLGVVDTNEINDGSPPSNWISLGNANDLPNSAGDTDEEESDLNRISIVMNSTDFSLSFDDDDIEGESSFLATNLPYVGAGRQIQKFVFAVKADDNNNNNNGHDIDDVIAVGVDANAKPSLTLDGTDLEDGATTVLTGLPEGGNGILSGATITFDSANSNELQIDDLDDGGAANLTTRIQVTGVTGSTATVTLAGGASISSGANGTPDLTIQGTEADINATLAGGVVITGGGTSGAATIQVTVDDAGNTGAGGALDSTHGFSFVVFANPTVTINQASVQADPVAVENEPVVFTVVFSEDVDGFTDGSTDVDLSASTTGGTLTAVIAEVAPNDGTTYEVSVTGVTSDGTVVASIPAGAAFRAGLPGDISDASSSDDNEVFVTVNVSPTADPLNQTIGYDDTLTVIELGDIIVSDANNFIDSRIDTDNTTCVFNFPVDDTTTGEFVTPDPTDSLGYSMEVIFTVSPSDVAVGGGAGSGENRKVIAEIGGTSNGSGVYAIDGIPYFIAKMNGVNTQDTITPLPGTDAQWDNTGVGMAVDEQVVIQLSPDRLTPGDENSVAVIFSLDSLEYSVNGAAPQTIALTGRAGQTNWAGNNTVTLGVGAGSRGGLTDTGGSTLHAAQFGNLAGGVISAKMWNVSDDTASITNALLEEEITATLQIQSYVDTSSGTLTDSSGGTESFNTGTGEWTITAGRAEVVAALIDLAFIVGGATADPTLIDVTIDDGDEDVSAALTGLITLNVNAPSTTELEDWRQQFFGSTANSGDGANTADPNNNGLINIIEFGLGLDPTAIGGGSLAESGGTITSLGAPILVVDGAGAGLHTLRYTARADEGSIADLTVTPQASDGDPTTISSWTDLAPGAAIATGNFNGIDVEMFEVTLPGQPASTLDQGRVQVSYTGLE